MPETFVVNAEGVKSSQAFWCLFLGAVVSGNSAIVDIDDPVERIELACVELSALE